MAQHQFFEDEAFIRYLKYLQYWKQPEYAKYVIYPHALFFLDNLQNERFRNELKKREFMDFLAKQQAYHWQYYRKNRELKATEESSTTDQQ